MGLEQELIHATKKAGQHIKRNAFSVTELSWKKKDDPVTNLDKEAEQIFKNHMSKVGNFNFIGEEFGSDKNGSDITLIVDPIDGTKSFVRREFYCSFSLGVHHKEKGLIGGFVYDFMKGILYGGMHGDMKVEYNGKQYDAHPDLSDFSKIRVSIDKDIALRELLEKDPRISPMEKSGSIALGMAELAAGNYDASLSYSIGKAESWDVAGGLYLFNSAGIIVTDIHHQPFTLENAKNGMMAYNKRAEKILKEYL